MTRSFISVAMATFQPSPTPPMRWESGMRASVKKISLNSASPVICRSGRTSTPCLVHVDVEVRRARGASARRDRCARAASPSCATCAMLVQTFCPFTIHSSPSRTAAVASDATSDPAPGSLNIWHQISSHVNVGPQQPRLLLFGTERDERGPGHADAHHVAQQVLRRVRGDEPLVDEILEAGIEPRPPLPSGKWIQASPRSNCAPQNSSVGRARCSASSSSVRASIARPAGARARRSPSCSQRHGADVNVRSRRGQPNRGRPPRERRG